MSADAAFDMLKTHGSKECTAQFWMSDTPAREFKTLRECLLWLADRGQDEPLPNVHVHSGAGEIAVNGPDLEDLIRAAAASRAAT
ncbi:hypothetical protein ACQKLX_07215 [Bosea sp. NPDC003192]|uniref:hypothetical protein n=1 Tax=Bosea sp. NPDC003192 TaxID=3390551 RepID=UPI003D01C1C7